MTIIFLLIIIVISMIIIIVTIMGIARSFCSKARIPSR